MGNKEQSKKEEGQTPMEPVVVPKSKFEQMLDKNIIMTSDGQTLRIERHFTSKEAYDKFYNIEE